MSPNESLVTSPRKPLSFPLCPGAKGANRAAKEAEAITDSGYPRWQGGKRGVTGARDEKDEKDLLLLRWRQIEGPSGSTIGRAAERSSEEPTRVAIIQIQGIQGKGGYLSLDMLDNRVEG